jgi:hypothetical protein
MFMASLADLLDPDQWILSGKSLLDFPWPEGNNEREAVKLILSRRPLLNAHYERWSKRVMEALGRRGGEKVGGVFAEEYLRELREANPRFVMNRSAGKQKRLWARSGCLHPTQVS